MAEKKGSEGSEPMVPFGFDAMMEMQRPALTAMAQLNTRLYASLAAVNKEWASFVTRRLKEDLSVPQQLAECKTMQDLYRVYADFFQNACSQYQSGLEQMTKLGKSIAEDTIHSLQASGEERRTQH
jgi:Phasin protein